MELVNGIIKRQLKRDTWKQSIGLLSTNQKKTHVNEIPIAIQMTSGDLGYKASLLKSSS